MLLNKLNVLPFRSNIYPKRKGRMAGNYKGSGASPACDLCLIVSLLYVVLRAADVCK